MRYGLSLMGMVCLAVAAVVSAQTNDEEAVEGLLGEYFAAINAGDVDGYLACFADDAIWMPPNEPAVTGKEAWRQANPEAFTTVGLDLTLTLDEVVVPGDWAFARGTVTGTLTPAEGEPVEVSSKNLWILQRQGDGSWKVSRSIRNSNNPPAEM